MPAAAPKSPLDELSALLQSADAAATNVATSCNSLTHSLSELGKLTSPVSSSASDLVRATSNLTAVTSGLAHVQKSMTLPNTSPQPLLAILSTKPFSHLAFPAPSATPIYNKFYNNPDPAYQALSWKNKTLPPGLISDSHSAFSNVCQTLAATNKHAKGQYANYLAAKQLQESGNKARVEWIKAFEGLTKVWAGEFQSMKGDDADSPFSPDSNSPPPPPASPHLSKQSSWVGGGDDDGGSPSSPRRFARRSVSFSPPPEPFTSMGHKFLPKQTVTSIRRLFTLLTTNTASLYYPPRSFLTTSIYATPPSHATEIRVSYLTETLSASHSLPACLKSALDRSTEKKMYPDNILYGYAPTNLPYLDAYVHTRLLVITESLVLRRSNSVPPLKRRGSSEVNQQDQSVDQSYDVCVAIVALSEILTVEREGYMELVSESLAKLRSHEHDDDVSAEFCGVYEKAVNMGFEVMSGYVVALFRLLTVPITSPSLPAASGVRDITVAATNSLRVLSAYYESLSHLTSLTESIHSSSAGSQRYAGDTLPQQLLKGLTTDLTTSALAQLSDLSRHLHTASTPIPPNLGVSAITSSAVYSIRVISSFKDVYSKMQRHSRKCETEGMDGVIRSIVIALMDNIQRQGHLIQDSFGHHHTSGSTGPLTPGGRRTSIDLGTGLSTNESMISRATNSMRGGGAVNTIAGTAYRAVFVINNNDYLRHALSPDAATLRRQSQSYVDDKSLNGENDDDDQEDEPEHEIDSSWFSDMLSGMTSKSEEVLIAETFGTLFEHIGDVDTAAFKYQNTKTKLLTLESGRLLKAKFGGFNDALSAMHGTMATLALPEAVRAKVICSGNDMVQESYQKFFETYSVYNFSKKNMSDYLRYPPAIAQSVFEELFRG
jgi:hypothetical protein